MKPKLLLIRTPEQKKADEKPVVEKKLVEKVANSESPPSTGVTFFQVPSTVERVIHYWNDKDRLKKLRLPVKDQNNAYMISDGTFKTFQYVVKTIKRLFAGTAFASNEFVLKNRKFTVKEVKLAIDHFHTAATSIRHKPLKKDSLLRFQLDQFFYSAYYKTDNEQYRSLFLYYIENEPQPRMAIAGEAPVDKFPGLTNKLCKETERVFRFNLSDIAVRNWLTMAANKLWDFYKKYNEDGQWVGIISVKTMVEEFINAALEWQTWKDDRKIIPQTFTQDWFINDVFMRHCINMEMLVKEDSFSRAEDEGLDLNEGYDDYLEPLDANDPETRKVMAVFDANNQAMVEVGYWNPSETLDFLASLTDEERDKEEELTWAEKERYEKERGQYENASYD